jgi:hypothetical protein
MGGILPHRGVAHSPFFAVNAWGARMYPRLWKHLIAVALSVLVFVGLAMWNGVVAVLFGLAALTWFLSRIYWYYAK